MGAEAAIAPGTAHAWPMGGQKDPAGSYIACVGGTEAAGRFVDRPWPDMLERMTGRRCLNLGRANSSIDGALRDPATLAACAGAVAVVLEVTGARNLSNRFYEVHPRRNDRFLRAATALEALYPEIDFADFCFTRHLLRELERLSPDRFALVREELQRAWSARMKRFLQDCPAPVQLVWFSDAPPPDGPAARGLGPDPLFVTAPMIDALRPLARGVTCVVPSAPALADGAMTGRPGRPLGPRAHEEAATALAAALCDLTASRSAPAPG
ncbi:DUF6473 family protein [Wenxinia marina]|uniref:DUF6473 domain-containing protein n=1 Tax=Wenxinia marina DSM 24838 TaxID=1123501 RepID=A0A0D0QHT2_9RHOB|nr:DUF6473 family protein [Wenxinia marina]KIQ70618.1 hypothetical protein Wenmar_00996 [Wenxinia marina DSM 24838]GGL51724.1 hypothetical protein GCM10011392_02540 [Wenxinia marina]